MKKFTRKTVATSHDAIMKFEANHFITQHISYEFAKKVPIVEVQIDPLQKIYLDIDLNNNSRTLEPNKMGVLKYASRAIFWVQNIFQSVSFLM